MKTSNYLKYLIAIVIGVALVNAASSLYPNEPAGYTKFAEYDASVLPPSPAANFQTGKWYRYPATNGRLFIASDPTAPQSAPGVIVTHFPAVFQGGSAPVQFGGWDAGGQVEYSEFYFSMWIKINDTYGDGTYENEDVLTKMGWIGSGTTATASNQNFFTLVDNSSGCGSANPCNYIGTRFRMGLNTQGPQFSTSPSSYVNRNLRPNKDASFLHTVGQWHHWEAIFRISNPANTALCSSGGTSYCGDGEFYMWIDGSQVMNFTNVAYNSPINTKQFFNYYWNPTWGGSNNSFRTRDDYMLIDHIYMSGIKKGSVPAPAVCGNGAVEGTEQCDLGAANGVCPSTCSATCTTQTCAPQQTCGNGAVEGTEQCDLGSGNGACPSVCTATCATQTCAPTPKTGDLNNDGVVNILDVQRVVSKLGQSSVTSGEDINNDQAVDLFDLVILARNWG